VLKENEIGRLISADKVTGTAVKNPAGESLGTIEAVMIDKPSGEVGYCGSRVRRNTRHGQGSARAAMSCSHVRYVAERVCRKPRPGRCSKADRHMMKQTGKIMNGAVRSTITMI